MPARLGVALCLLFAGVPALGDVSAPAIAGDRTLPVHSLLGPFASIEAYCEQSRREDENMVDCAVVRRRGHTAAIVLRWGGHQRDVLLAIEDGAGWWINGDGILYDSNRGRGGFIIEALSDEPGGARLRGVQADWWKPISDEELDRFDHDIYYCFAIEVRCWGRAGGPVCSEPLPVAGRRDCGLGDEDDGKSFVTGSWDWEQQIGDVADGREVEFRRRAWSHFPTNSHGYGSSFEEMARLARTLAGTNRRIVVRPR